MQGWSALESEPRGQEQGAHPSHGNHAAIRRRIYDGIDSHVLRCIEHIRELRPELEEARFAEWENLGERHVEQAASWSFNTIAACIAKRPGWGDESGRLELRGNRR